MTNIALVCAGLALAYLSGLGIGWVLGTASARRRLTDYEGVLGSIASARYSEQGAIYHARCALMRGGAKPSPAATQERKA